MTLEEFARVKMLQSVEKLLSELATRGSGFVWKIGDHESKPTHAETLAAVQKVAGEIRASLKPIEQRRGRVLRLDEMPGYKDQIAQEGTICVCYGVPGDPRPLGSGWPCPVHPK